MGSLTNKTILIAGASGTIGAGIVQTALGSGASVIGLDLVFSDELHEFSERQPSRLSLHPVDVGNDVDVKRVLSEISTDIHAIVHAIGVAGPKGPIESLELSELSGLFTTNLFTAFNLVKYGMRLFNDFTGGRIVFIGSVAGKLGYKNRSAYAASKWALEGFSRSLAEELGPRKVSVNVVAPSGVDSTPLHEAVRTRVLQTGLAKTEAYESILSQSSQRELIEVDSIAQTVMFLLQAASRQISGQSISVDGCTSILN